MASDQTLQNASRTVPTVNLFSNKCEPLSFILFYIYFTTNMVDHSTPHHWIVITKRPQHEETICTRQMIRPCYIITVSLTQKTTVWNLLHPCPPPDHAELAAFHILGFLYTAFLPAKLWHPIVFQLSTKQKRGLRNVHK
jgi:hypothetical protein